MEKTITIHHNNDVQYSDLDHVIVTAKPANIRNVVKCFKNDCSVCYHRDLNHSLCDGDLPAFRRVEYIPTTRLYTCGKIVKKQSINIACACDVISNIEVKNRTVDNLIHRTTFFAQYILFTP